MRVVADEITVGSYAVRVWIDAEPGDEWADGPYHTVCVINRLSEELCEIAPCLGVLNNELNIMLGLKCMELGFTFMNFCVLEGERVTRWATYLRTENGMDYHQVNLVEISKQL